MKVNIVCYEDVNKWILGKFALKLKENLDCLGVLCSISNRPDPNADINHHIIYTDFKPQSNGIDTLMITHIDNEHKLKHLLSTMPYYTMGICMSRETMCSLNTLGIERSKVCYVNPAHDQKVFIKKIKLGISCRVQSDGRKREDFIKRLAYVLDPTYFEFHIMGDSWDDIVYVLRNKGFVVEYIPNFDRDIYYRFISELDYYIYTGMDEGQMGFVDAAAAGVRTIVTAQGYHLDAIHGISYPYTEYEQLESILLEIQEERSNLVNSVEDWTWLDYAKKHVEIWDYLLTGKHVQSNYKDGLNSLFVKIETKASDSDIKKIRKELRRTYYSQRYRFLVNRIKTEGLLHLIRERLSR